MDCLPVDPRDESHRDPEYVDFFVPRLARLVHSAWKRHQDTVFCVKGMYPAPHIHEHFTIHKWLRQTAYILTHNLNMLEHIANNGMNTTMHTDANIAQF